MQVLWLSMGQSLSVVCNIALFAIAARCFDKLDYATFRQVFLVFDIASPALGLGVGAALHHLLPRFSAERRSIVTSAIFLLLLSGSALGAASICFPDEISNAFDNPRLRGVLPWLGVYSPVVLAYSASAAVFISAGQSRALALSTVCFGLIPAVAVVGVIYAGAEIETVVVVRVVSCATVACGVLVYLIGSCRGDDWSPSVRSLRALLRLGTPLAAASVLGSIAIQVHGLVVAAECSPEQYAVYVTGALEVPIIGIVTGAITSVVMSSMSESCHAGRHDEALALFRLAAIRSASVILPSFAFLELFASDLIEALYSSAYAASAVPFRIMLLALPCRIVVYGAALIALGMSRAILLRSLIDLALSSSLAVLLVRVYGPNGAAMALVITLFVWTVPFNLRAIARGFGVKFVDCLPFSRIGAIFLISALVAVVAKAACLSLGLSPVVSFGVGAGTAGPFLILVMLRRGDLVLPGKLSRLGLEPSKRRNARTTAPRSP
jgi:O-antigen/teichoic acid export membrane protein